MSGLGAMRVAEMDEQELASSPPAAIAADEIEEGGRAGGAPRVPHSEDMDEEELTHPRASMPRARRRVVFSDQEQPDRSPRPRRAVAAVMTATNADLCRRPRNARQIERRAAIARAEAERRARMTPEERALYNAEARDRVQEGRDRMSEAERSAYNAEARDRVQEGRDRMSEAERSVYNAEARDRVQDRRDRMSEAERSVYLGEARDRDQSRRDRISEAERSVYNAEARDRVQEGRDRMSEAERSVYNAEARDRVQDRRDRMSEAERSVYNTQARERLQDRLQQLTPEQQRAHHDRRRSVENARRSPQEVREQRAAYEREHTRELNERLERLFSDENLARYHGRIDEEDDQEMLGYLAVRHPTSITKSLLFFHINGGLTKFSQKLPEGTQDLLDELGEELSQEQKCRMLCDSVQYSCGHTIDGEPEHVDVLGVHKQLHACATCGVRYLSITYEDRYYEHRLDEPGMKIFKLTEDQMAKYDSIPVRYLPVRSVFTRGMDRHGQPMEFFMHPELVYVAREGRNAGHQCIMMCKNCHDKYKQKLLYRRSIAAGWDLGWIRRIDDLPPLRLVEAMLLSKQRLYGAIIQLRTINNQQGTMMALRSNTIVFPQDGDALAQSAVRRLPDIDYVKNALKIVFLGPKAQFDRMQLQYIPDLQARPEVLYQYLRFYRTVTPDFLGEMERNEEIEAELIVLRNELIALRNALIAGAMISESEHAINVHRMAMDDVNHVRDTANVGEDGIAVINDHSLVYDSNTLMPSNQAVVNTIAATVADDEVRVPRSAVPSDDMARSATVIAQMFPHLFPFGTGFMRSAHLGARDIKHLLLQFTCEHARDTRFLFYIWNRQNIRAACATIRSSVRCRPGTYRRFMTTVNDPSFINDLRTAVSNPDSDLAHKITRKMMPYIRMTAGRVPFTPASRANAVTRLHSLAQRFGPASCFLTVSPDDVHSPLTIRLSHPTTAVGEFPNVDGGLCERLRDRDPSLPYLLRDHQASVDLHERALVKLVSDNPVASAHVFQKTMEVLTENLLGCKYSYRTHVSDCSLIKRGVLGRVTAYGDVTHSQGRGTVHAHSEIFGGITPRLLEKAAEYPAVRAAVIKHLESMYRCEADINAHARSVLDNLEARLRAQMQARQSLTLPSTQEGTATLSQESLTQRSHPSSTPARPLVRRLPSATVEDPIFVSHLAHEYNQSLSEIVTRYNIHTHTHSCTKTKRGQRECRYARPAVYVANTGPIQLRALPDDYVLSQRDPTQDPGHIPPRETISCSQQSTQPNTTSLVALAGERVHPSPRPGCPVFGTDDICGYADLAVDRRDTSKVVDKRCLVWQIRRPEIDITVENYHEMLAPDVAARIDVMSDKMKGLVVDTLRRRNGMTVEYNDAISLFTKCNTCCSFMGSTEQAKNAMAYMSRYMANDTGMVTSMLSVVLAAREHVDKYPSIAENAGTEERNTIYLLQHITNSLCGKVEISASMCALLLLGDRTWFSSSENFTMVFVRDAIKQIKAAVDHTDDVEDDTNDAESDDESDVLTSDPDETDDEETVLPPSYAEGVVTIDDQSGTLYRLDENRRELVSQYHNYIHRGRALKNLSLIEYPCLVGIRKVQARQRGADDDERDEDDDRSAGPVPSATYPFEGDHKLGDGYEQYLRRRQLTPIMAGRPPPQFPDQDEHDEEWQRKADEFGTYMLVLFKPFDYTNVSRFRLGYVAYTIHVRSLKSQASRNFIARARLAWMENMLTCSSIATMKRLLYDAYRFMNAFKWKHNKDGGINLSEELDADDTPMAFEGTGVTARQIREASDLITQLRMEQIQAGDRTFDYATQTAETLTALFDAAAEGIAHELPPCVQTPPVWVADSLDDTRQEIDTVCASVRGKDREEDRDDEMEENDLPRDESYRPIMLAREFKVWVSDQLGRTTLSADQKAGVPKVLHFYRLWLKETQNGTRPFNSVSSVPFLFLHGGPGSGKTYLCEVLTELIAKMTPQFLEVPVLKTAYTGVAASNLDRGMTVSKLCGLGIVGKDDRLSADKIAPTTLNRCRGYFSKKAIVILDEISFMSAQMLGRVSSRVTTIVNDIRVRDQQAQPLPSGTPFGGMCWVFVGDLVQLPPVKASPIYTSMLDHYVRNKPLAPNTYGYEGVSVFKKYTKLELTSQHRARGDAVHTRHINELRAMDRQYPVTPEILDSLKPLTASDAVHEEWRYAPVIVCTNVERQLLNREQAIRFAKEHGKCVIQWNAPLPSTFVDKQTGNPVSIMGLNESNSSDFTMQQLFVEGAPAYLLVNLNPSLKIANGSRVHLRSLSFEVDESEEHSAVKYAETINRIRSAAPGEVVDLGEYRPYSVNVAVPDTDLEQWRADGHQSLSDREVVIPIVMSSNSQEVKIGNTKFNIKNHPFELGFAITFHKVQGKTIDKLILQLNRRKFKPTIDFHVFFVGISRVTDLKNMRVLQWCGEGKGYLLMLKPSADLRLFLQGYGREGSWDPTRVHVRGNRESAVRENIERAASDEEDASVSGDESIGR